MIASAIAVITCRAEEQVEIPDVSSILFNRDWGKNLRTALGKNAKESNTDPVVVIYKASGITPTDDRVILITPVVQDKPSEILDSPIITSYEVSVIDPERNFKIKKLIFQGKEMVEIDNLWVICSDLTLAAGKEESKVAENERLETPKKYFIFSTFRSKEGLKFFSGHTAGVVKSTAQGTKSQKMAAACDQLVSTMLPLE